MKQYSSREVIAILKRHGWYKVGQVGSHTHYKHPTNQGKATIPHPRKRVSDETMKGIAKQTGIKF